MNNNAEHSQFHWKSEKKNYVDHLLASNNPGSDPDSNLGNNPEALLTQANQAVTHGRQWQFKQ